MRGKMGFSRMSQWMVLALMPIYIVTGCGDLEPEMQDTRTVILKMDFHGKSSSRTSRVDPDELINYKTHLIMVLTSIKTYQTVVTGIIEATRESMCCTTQTGKSL